MQQHQRLRFVQVSDTHLMPPHGCRCWWMRTSPEILLQQAIDQIQLIPDLDFVVFTGDLVDRADVASFEHFERLASQLSVPYFCSAGNHDLDTSRDPAVTTPRFDRQQFLAWCEAQSEIQPAATGYADYSATPVPGLRILALDASQGEFPEPQGMLRPAQYAWLQAELAAHPREMILVLIHQPPLASWIFRHYRLLPAHSRRLRHVLQEHPHVVAVLSGHLHLPKVYTRRHTTYLTAPPLVGPVSAFRLFEISPLHFGEGWGELRYEWHPVAQTDPAPLWHALAMGTPGDRQGQTLIPLPQGWSSVRSLVSQT